MQEQTNEILPVEVSVLGPDVRCHELAPDRPPLFIEPAGDRLLSRDAFQAWTATHKPDLENLIVRHGGIVLRGFPTQETTDFAALTDLFPSFEAGYAGGVAPRAAISGKVMEATRLDAKQRLTLHSEMAYLRHYPARIAFFCRRAAPIGGETLIGDVRGLVDAMPPQLVQRLEQAGSVVTRNYAAKQKQLDANCVHMELRGWNQAFYTDDPAEVEALCEQRGLRPVWNEDGSLTVFTSLNPLVVHPQTGRKLYRSLLHVFLPNRSAAPGQDEAMFKAVRDSQKHQSGVVLGNGEPLPEADTKLIRDLVDDVTYAWPWRDGDIMILDNLQVWHGRNPYEGPRDVQVALLA